MPRYIEIKLEKRNVSCVAQMLDDDAPLTCESVWNALPLSGQTFHAKYASNEVYFLTPTFAKQEPGRENATVMPIPADVMYFYVPKGNKVPPGMRDQCRKTGLIDIAVFYGRDNYLHGQDGHFPGNVFATIVENYKEFAAACQDVWRSGHVGETMSVRRLEGYKTTKTPWWLGL